MSVLFAALILLLPLAVSADTPVYSTAEDPLVSLSYVNDVLKPQIISQVYDEILSKLISDYPILSQSALPSSDASGTYEVVHMTVGQYFWAGGSCEVLMTAGSANVVITKQENIDAGVGLNDLTAAQRLRNGDALPRDHYVIIARGDGRGFYVTSEEAYFLVRGEYDIGNY